MRLEVTKEGDPVVVSDGVRDNDVEMTVRKFVGTVWLFKWSSVCGEVSVLVG